MEKVQSLSVQRASICFYWFDKLELRPQLIHWSLKYQGLERQNLQGVSSRRRFECGMIFPTLRLIPERCMGSKVQSTVVASPSRVLRARESNL